MRFEMQVSLNFRNHEFQKRLLRHNFFFVICDFEKRGPQHFEEPTLRIFTHIFFLFSLTTLTFKTNFDIYLNNVKKLNILKIVFPEFSDFFSRSHGR